MRIAYKFYEWERTKYRKLYRTKLTEDEVAQLVRFLRKTFKVSGKVALHFHDEWADKDETGFRSNEGEWDWDTVNHVHKIYLSKSPSLGIVAHEMAHAITFEFNLAMALRHWSKTKLSKSLSGKKLPPGWSGHYGLYQLFHKEAMELMLTIKENKDGT